MYRVLQTRPLARPESVPENKGRESRPLRKILRVTANHEKGGGGGCKLSKGLGNTVASQTGGQEKLAQFVFVPILKDKKKVPPLVRPAFIGAGGERNGTFTNYRQGG